MAARLLLCIVALTSISPSLAITPQWDDFASGNQITASGGTAAVNLDPALAYDSTYTVHYYVQVTLSSPGLDPYVGLTVAVDANNGSGWVERAAFLYERATSGTSTWSHEQKPIVVSGLDPNDDIRLRAKSFVKHDANGSFVIRGGDGGGSNPETYHGVTYDTVVGSPAPPIVSFRNHNGDNRDRSLCLTSSAGEAVAWQCGDLLVTHSLPGYRTMGRERTLTLLYNSAQAVPKPVVAVGVTQGGLAPSQVFVRLSINGFPKDSAIYGGWANGTRQIVMPYDAGNDSSGLYAFSLYVRNTFSGSTPDTTVSDTLLVVNRKSTLYGAGWSLAGIEELRFNQPGGKILWVGGDGSAKVFRPVIGDSLFVGALGGFRDSLFRFDSAGIRWWRRQLRYGVSVTYRDSVGSGRAKHVRTTNRVGNSTFFRWSGDTLTKILVPPDTAAFYSLSYAAGRLDKITDPAGRVLDVTIASDRLTQIIDPDTNIYSTSFAYDAAGRLIGRTNRRGFTNRYAYTNGLRVTADSIRLDTAAVTYGITTFTPWDERGLKTAFSGNTAIEVGNVFTKIDGALAVGDTAEFWVDRWGAPTSVRDPLGSQTFIARGDAANPALVTRVQTPDGRIVAATYDTPRGRLVTVVDSTFEGTGAPQVVTSARHIYGQSTAADSPTEIRTPVDTTRFAYDPTLGLTDSVIAPGGHRTTFRYFLSGTQRGLVQKVIDRGVRIVDTMTWTRNLDSLVTSFMYDHWGNDSTITTPQGNVTRYEYDSFRRPVRVYDPLSHLREYAYNRFNEPTSAAAYAPGPLTTYFSYQKTGLVDSVIDPRKVKRKWLYDAAGRAVGMIDEAGGLERRFFGASGLLDSIRTRTSEVIRNRYDAGGRLIATIYPSHENQFGLPGNALNATIPGDSVATSYDSVRRPLVISNSRSTVTFVYNREGTVRSERQVVRNATGQVVLDLTMRYWYDLGSRRVKFFNGADTVFYTYGTDARLSKLKIQWIGTSQQPDSFFFFWDALGRRDSVVYSNNVKMSFGYDRDGMLRMVCARHPVTTPQEDYLEQRLKWSTNADGLPTFLRQYAGDVSVGATCANNPNNLIQSTAYTYDARHQLLSDNLTYAYDSSGNRVSSKSGGGAQDDSLEYSTQSNRILKRQGNAGSAWVTYYHDLNGSRISQKPPNPMTAGLKVFYYDALGQTTGIMEYDGAGNYLGGSDWCRYDALGRRIYGCDLGNSQGIAAFDGENVIRTNEWRYVHGPGVDDPLVAVNNVGNSWAKYYYVTDGRGRMFGFTDSLARDMIGDVVFFQNGGNQAGAIHRSTTFLNTRAETPQAAGVSFYRNRYYDQGSGRWTQEDPIGIAGGANLYRYSGNNPALFTDPFGLRICFLGTQKEVQELKEGTEEATKTIIVLDRKNCVVKWEARGREGFEEIQARFAEMADPTTTVFKVRFAGEGQSSKFLPETNTARVRRGDIGFLYFSGIGAACTIRTGRFTLGAIVLHELVGHGYNVLTTGEPAGQREAIRIENLYHSARNQLPRCDEEDR